MKFFATVAALAAVPMMVVAQKDLSKTVEADIMQIDNNTLTLNKTLSTIGPNDTTISFGTLVTLLNEATAIQTALNKTTADCKASSNFNGADAIYIGIENLQLVSDVESLLDNFDYRVQAFKNQGVAFVVAQQLQGSQAGSSAYTSAISPKLGILGGLSPAISQNLNQKFNQTIALYSS